MKYRILLLVVRVRYLTNETTTKENDRTTPRIRSISSRPEPSRSPVWVVVSREYNVLMSRHVENHKEVGGYEGGPESPVK